MHNERMDIRRLEFLLELSRLGSMALVAEHLNTTTSTVSQQIAKLSKESGTALVEPDGRRVRLTPAGRRLADHAAVILGAVEAARVDLDPASEPAGTLRVAGGATLIRRTLLPVVNELAASHPDVEVRIFEFEPDEALAGLDTDDIDLALTYDYSLVPLRNDPRIETVSLWSRPWSLGVRAGHRAVRAENSLDVMLAYADQHWIGNSRNTADEDVLRLLGALAGFEPRVSHQFDSLELVAGPDRRGLWRRHVAGRPRCPSGRGSRPAHRSRRRAARVRADATRSAILAAVATAARRASSVRDQRG